MCLAIPGKIVALTPICDSAVVEILGVRRAVDTGLLADEAIALGEWVLIHVGFALTKISEEEALDQLRILAELGQQEEAIRELQTNGEQEGLSCVT